jgi:CheY-like chemotaxis protein
MVVDDHADTRAMMMELLELAGGFHTIGAADGMEALRLLQEQRPRLILLDLTMPGLDGWQFRARQAALADTELAAVPVIVMSALHDAEQHAHGLGAVACIRKPEDFEWILTVVRRHCGDPMETL